MDYMKIYQQWCSDPYFDDATKAELKAIENNKEEIEDRFYRSVRIWNRRTAWSDRAGTNRMNIYTVRQATQGLTNYVLSQNGQEKRVAIAYDSRRMSTEFATEAALCLNANGIKTYILTVCVRHRNCPLQ